MTNVAAGAGLAGGGTGEITLAIASGGVGSLEVADDSLTGSDLAAGAVGGAEILDGAITERTSRTFRSSGASRACRMR